jgi:acetoin:2,6-dichlorophenolindophenol oxidoreductase subunit beta
MSTATESPALTNGAARTPPQIEPEPGSRALAYGRAFNEGLAQVMRADPDVFVAGEDVAGYGGVFRLFVRLLEEFGPRRVIDTPISETAIVGLGVGAAACGLRPVIDLMFSDFMAVCFDQIVNQAAKLKYMFGGSVTVPLTISCVAGAGVGGSAQHSQSWEAMLAHVPGLKVVMPSNAYDAKGLIVAAVRDDNPVVVMLNKTLLGNKSPVPEQLYQLPIGKAATPRPGRDVTVVALGRMVGEALAAADSLAAADISAEVVDLRSVQPLDSATILESVRRTSRAVVVHEAVTFGGIGAEIAAQIQDEAFDYLDAPVLRLGAPFAPVPFSPVLEKAYVPDRERIAAGVARLLGRS